MVKFERCDKCGLIRRGNLIMTIRFVLARIQNDLIAAIMMPVLTFIMGFVLAIAWLGVEWSGDWKTYFFIAYYNNS